MIVNKFSIKKSFVISEGAGSCKDIYTDVLAQSSNKDVIESISKNKNLSKKARTILGFMEKFTYYDSTHN